MGEPCELYLELSLIGSGAPCENVEDQLNAVNYPAPCDFREASFLRRRKPVVENDQVRFLFLNQIPELLCLPGAYIGAGVRSAAPREKHAGNLNAARYGELPELIEVLVLIGSRGKLGLDQDCPPREIVRGKLISMNKIGQRKISAKPQGALRPSFQMKSQEFILMQTGIFFA